MYADRHGRTIETYQEHLPKRASDFGKAGIVRSRVADDEFRQLDIAQFCWACGRSVKYGQAQKLDVHHIVGGSGRRSDERCNFSVLCAGLTKNACHYWANTAALPMGLMLSRKWIFDGKHCDWARLALIRGSFLPDFKFYDTNDYKYNERFMGNRSLNQVYPILNRWGEAATWAEQLEGETKR